MFSRRRSRSHYDPSQYSTGLQTRSTSASASAAANAYYSRRLGSNAAAEAIRRHSLDQSDAEAIRNFRPTASIQTHQQPAARRTYSLSNTPVRRANSLTSRSPQVSYSSPQPSVPHQRFYSPNDSMVGRQPPLRRNSLSNQDRSNSLTRTQTVANRDASGRTLSLTTTTVRQMGSFEIVTSKETPVGSSASHLRQPRGPFVDIDSSNSVHSVDSELVGIQEDPEEEVEHVPLRSPIRSPMKTAAARQTPASPTSITSGSNSYSSEGHASLSEVSDATPSPPGSISGGLGASDVAGTSGGATGNSLAPPVPPQSKHRESSPARSALRHPTGLSSSEPQQPKSSRVSFGDDKEFVYESYDYDDQEPEPEPPRRSAGSAAAAAAARARQQQQTRPETRQPIRSQPKQQPRLQQPKQQPQPQPQLQQQLVMNQPAMAVTKRASEQSLRSKRQSARAAHSTVGGGLPYPQARTWDVQPQYGSDDDNDLQFVDAPDSSASSRSSARPHNAAVVPEPQAVDESANQAQIYAQAVALAQQRFNEENAKSSALQGSQQNGQPKHYYRSLLAPANDNYDDDAASIRSDSSFSRQSNSRPAKATKAGSGRRMTSLRQPETPTLRSGQDRGRKGSLLNQARPQMAPASAPPKQPQPGGFRSYSLRQQARPDPATLLSGGAPGGSSGAFKSRVADSDSEDEGFSSVGGHNTVSGNKMSFGDVFSPNTDVKDLFKSRSQSEQLPKTKKSGFFKRMFAKKS